jgi:hypothetical protein
MKSTIHIGQLNLRIPGNSAETGHRVANGIGQNLAERIPAGRQGHLGALSVRVRVTEGATEADMSNAIADAIAKMLSS